VGLDGVPSAIPKKTNPSVTFKVALNKTVDSVMPLKLATIDGVPIAGVPDN